jgi:hypothetical protein
MDAEKIRPPLKKLTKATGGSLENEEEIKSQKIAWGKWLW